jgi:predicted Holliday junction resolvase-like endonuclease
MSEDALYFLLYALGIILFVLIIKYLLLKRRIERTAEERFERWRDADKYREVQQEAETQSLAWRQVHEKEIRDDAVKRSEAVIKGKVTEHLVPFFEEFDFDPGDARFLGSPIDLIVFDGLSAGEVERIVFVEVKTGKRPTMSKREKSVAAAVEGRLVEHVVMHVKR